MIEYRKFAPSAFDVKGLGVLDRQDWLVLECVGNNRDAGPLARSNWRVVTRDLIARYGEDVEIHRFGHWACGWLEICIVRPGSGAAIGAETWECALSDYPVASDEDFSREESEEADQVWRECYTLTQRLEYIRENRAQFEFSSLADMLACVRGKFFAGYASELLG